MSRGYRSPAAPPRPVMPSRKPVKAPAPWTEAHQREALAYLLTLARDTVLLGEPGDLDDVEIHGHGAHEVVDEDHFVVALALYEAEPTEAVRRVRALAEGRLVRETGWRTEGPIYTEAQRTKAMTVRVTRVRSASR